ncbi:MAG: hypothetical protein AAFQ37_04715, partial [Bacteroidota bacterium]
MQQIYLLLCGVLSITCTTSLSTQPCSDYIKDVHVIHEAQLVRSKVQTVVMRANYTYSTQLVCDQGGLQLKLFSKGGVVFAAGDELILASENGDFLNLAFESVPSKAKIGESPVSTNVLSLDLATLDWLNTAGVTTFYFRSHSLN